MEPTDQPPVDEKIVSEKMYFERQNQIFINQLNDICKHFDPLKQEVSPSPLTHPCRSKPQRSALTTRRYPNLPVKNKSKHKPSNAWNTPRPNCQPLKSTYQP